MESKSHEVPLAGRKNKYFTGKLLRKCSLDGAEIANATAWRRLPALVIKHLEALNQAVSADLRQKVDDYNITATHEGVRMTRLVLADVKIPEEKCVFTVVEGADSEVEEEGDDVKKLAPPVCDPLPALNMILYGPPGTGKTYALRNEYFKLFTDTVAKETSEEHAQRVVQDLSWWEVVGIALLDQTSHSAKVTRLMEHPLVKARNRLAANRNMRAMLWAALQNHTNADCPNVKYKNRSEPLLFSKDKDSNWSIDTELAKQDVPELLIALEDFKKGPTGGSEIKRFRFTTFHQSFSYEDFVEGIKPQLDDSEDTMLSYEIRPGLFKEIALIARNNPANKYALFIDEVNRGNIASIFGELITLIEEDKRLGEENALEAVPPYSRELFGVPGNLYIIGTMNTADRSVEALDTALRRRFVFKEMRPNAELVASRQPDGLKVDLARLMETINTRIERLLDHDHAIGHSFFLKVEDLPSLRRVFKNEILPLLREFFYGNPAKIGMILGSKFITKTTGGVKFKDGEWGNADLDEKDVFVFADPETLSEEDFISIYA